MKILLCAILALPLVLLGVESVNSATKQNLEDLEIKSESSANQSIDALTDSQDSPLESIKTKEPSGWILGIGAILGYTQTKPVGLQRYAMNDGDIFYTIVDNSRFEYGAEVILGHKSFYGDSGIFGLRFYLDYTYYKSKISTAHTGGLNLDMLFNFNQHEAFKVGLITGIWAGGGVILYDKKTICSYDDSETYTCELGISLAAGANIGLRFVVYDNYAFEVLAQPRFNLLSNQDIAVLGLLRFIYTF